MSGEQEDGGMYTLTIVWYRMCLRVVQEEMWGRSWVGKEDVQFWILWCLLPGRPVHHQWPVFLFRSGRMLELSGMFMAWLGCSLISWSAATKAFSLSIRCRISSISDRRPLHLSWSMWKSVVVEGLLRAQLNTSRGYKCRWPMSCIIEETARI